MKDFILVLPEIILAVTLIGIVIGEIGYHGERLRLITLTALIGLTGAFIQALLSYRYGPSSAFGGTLSIDSFSLFFKLFFIGLAAFGVVTSNHSKEVLASRRAELYALLIASALAMSVAASATDLLLAFVALQFANASAYFLVAYSKRSVHSTEAAVKHLAFGTLSGAMLLYGMAILFYFTQTLHMGEMHQALLNQPISHASSLVTFMLVFLALSYHMTAFPMYLATPDVLEGAPTPVSAFLSIGTRAAGFAVALRFFVNVFANPTESRGSWQPLGQLDWPSIVALVSGLTMLCGSLLAMRQTGAKRLVSYLVVAESGFLLIGLLVLNETGVSALLYSLLVQFIALLGAFYVLSFLVDELQSDRLADLKGMLGRAVPESVCLILFLVCLVGLPPLPGFVGKFALVGAAIQEGWYFLAIIAILSIAIGSAAIARLAFSLIGDFPQTGSPDAKYHAPRLITLAVLFLLMLLVGIFADSILAWTGQSLRFILW